MNNSRKQFVISVMSRDRVGIVYEISTAISEVEGDIADLRQSVLRGYFTMILLASFPASVGVESIKQKLYAVNANSPTLLEIAVRQVKDVAVIQEPIVPEDAYVLTASGQDHIGFVAALTGFCAHNRINIIDLYTKVAGDAYIMILLVDPSRSEPIEVIRQKLKQFEQETDLNIFLQHYDIFRATNEISIR